MNQNEAADPVVRAFAFSAGGFDSVMQLGVAHALLVTRAAAPDYVVGVSAGAINATALTDILQAGAVATDPQRRLAIQADRLREFINAYHEMPASLVDAILPDSLEIFASAPLDPLESPLHFSEERKTREKANASKAGLIDVVNTIFGIRLPISAFTVMIRRLLGIIEAGEKPTWGRRVWTELSSQAGLLGSLWRHLVPVADIFGTLFWAAMWAEHLAQIGRFSSEHFAWIHRLLSALLPLSAGGLLTRWRAVRRMIRLARVAFKILVTAILLAVATILWTMIWAPFFVPIKQLRRSKRLRGGKGTSAIWERVLGYYSLRDGLANTDVLRQQIIRCFDQTYYGKVKADTAIPRALWHDTSLNETTHEQRRRVGDYSKREPSIGLGIVAADVESGDLKVLPPQIPIVDALAAAIALVPFFPAALIDAAAETKHATDAGKSYPPRSGPDRASWYIDGSNISTQAIGPLMGYLREEIPTLIAKGKKRIDVYPVATLPIGKGELPSAGEMGKGVIRGALRALQLQRMRDAQLERRLTALYTSAVGPGVIARIIDGVAWVAADIHPIELQEPAGLNMLMIFSSDQEKQRIRTLETIAAGCRATVEVVMRDALLDAAKAARVPGSASDLALIADRGAILCRMALRRRLGAVTGFPGDVAANVPGIDEVCMRCSFYMPISADPVQTLKESAAALEKHLEPRPYAPTPAPEWPVSGRVPEDPPARSVSVKNDNPHTSPFREVPVRSMLFGGGVFRGVCQVGVLNAANEIGLQPDVVAGASVGAIMAAMIARVFRAPQAERQLRIGRIAATFLAIDRLVLTDRFADFVRRLTLRAGQTVVSPHDIDRVFRRFDADRASHYNNRTRRVAAGIERLLYISPFELSRLARQLREDQREAAGADLLEDAQDFLRRGGIGEEILGSEPLRLLIELHVLDDVKSDIRDVLLDYFSPPVDDGQPRLQFFATTTDVTRGRLEILKSNDSEREPSLLFSLLASSAFPVIFRPRQSWEVFRRTKESTQFVDGGIMDNLPLYAVAEHLNSVLTKPSDRRPGVPHLLFTASLETERQTMKPGGWDVEQTRRSWRRLSSRAKTFTYNRKIDAYARVQRVLRRLVEGCDPPPQGLPLLDLEVVAVKPKWLPGTFGFHPMLGFKRWKQAASIAHGCASTFGTMVAHDKANPTHMAAWRVKLEDIDEQAIQTQRKPPTEREPKLDEREIVLVPRAEGKKPGTCYFRMTKVCPFSLQGTEGIEWSDDPKFNEKYRKELQQIYTACGQKSNHRQERS